MINGMIDLEFLTKDDEDSLQARSRTVYRPQCVTEEIDFGIVLLGVQVGVLYAYIEHNSPVDYIYIQV